jgi:GntR family transcriptional regulator
MLVKIDLDDSRPLFDQVAAAVRADIVSGRLVAGDRLPSARELAEALAINVHTVLHAYQRLRDEGLVDLRRGRGAVVSASAAPLAALADDIRALVQRAEALGVPASVLAAAIPLSASAQENTV